MLRLLGLGLAWLAFACAGPQQTPPSQIQATTADAVGKCTQVGAIEERIESPTDDPELEGRAKESVRARASKLGADRVVYEKTEIEKNYVYLRADAYRCD